MDGRHTGIAASCVVSVLDRRRYRGLANDTPTAPEKSEQKEPSTPEPKKETATMYGTRKRRPCASYASAASTLEQIRGPMDDDEEIEH